MAEQYHRYRPRIPQALLDWALPPAPDAVLDLGAGTGALTELLAPRVPTVIAVEPDPDMRRVLARAVPAADVRSGTAEAIPLADGSVDAVLVSAAWHWFDVDAAVPEIARVLRPGGRLAVFGNGPDVGVEWVRRLRDWSPDTGDTSGAETRARRRRHRVELPPGAPFTDLETTEQSWTWDASPDDVLGLLVTYSNTIVADGADRAARRARALTVLQTDPATRGRERIAVPMRAAAVRTTRKPDGVAGGL